jgi:peptidoglycan hydrolase CwlO-like protein
MAADRPDWVKAAVMVGAAILVVVVLAVFLGRSEQTPVVAVPSASVAPSSSADAQPEAAPAIVASSKPADAGVDAEIRDAEDEPPPPWVVEEDASNPEIKPELPQTPEWKIGKTQRILSVVTRRAARVEKEIEALDAQGKKAEADEKRVLLSRLKKRMDAMKKDIAGYEKQIVDDGGVLPPHGFAPDGAPLP